MTYRIYRNLHKSDWTIQHKVPQKGWRKLTHHKALYAIDVGFTVSDAGRDRACVEGRKNVHAFAVVDDWWEITDDKVVPLMDAMPHTITYSPFRTGGFATRDTVNLEGARMCLFAPSGRIYAYQLKGGWEQLRLEEALGSIKITVPAS